MTDDEDFDDLLPPPKDDRELLVRLSMLVKMMLREHREAAREARDYRHNQAGRAMEMERRLETVERVLCDPGKPPLKERIAKIELAVIPPDGKSMADRIGTIETIVGNAKVSWKTVGYAFGAVATIASAVTWTWSALGFVRSTLPPH